MLHDGLVWLHFGFVPLTTRAVVDALLDATISAGIKYASFHHCGLSQIALPVLGRLLQSPGFEGPIINSNDGVALFEGPALPAFCEDLHNSTSLKVIVLESVNLWADVAAATELIAALERHPALHGLWLSNNPTDGTPATQQAAGECLARRIARSTSLHVLNLPGSALGVAGRAPIFQALRNNSSLTTLGFRTLAGQGEERISTIFLRDVVLPAVRANTRLRRLEGLHSVDEEEGNPVLREVEDILEARRQADKNTV